MTLLDEEILEGVQRELFASNPIHDFPFARSYLIDSRGELLIATRGYRKQAILVTVQEIAGPNHQPANINRHSNPDYTEARVTHHRAASKILKSQRAYFRQIANAAIANQSNRAQAREERGHYFTAVSGIIRMAANLLKSDNSRLRRFLHCPVEFDKSLDIERLTLADRFHLSRYRIAAHSAELRKDTPNLKRHKAFPAGTDLE